VDLRKFTNCVCTTFGSQQLTALQECPRSHGYDEDICQSCGHKRPLDENDDCSEKNKKQKTKTPAMDRHLYAMLGINSQKFEFCEAKICLTR